MIMNAMLCSRTFALWLAAVIGAVCQLLPVSAGVAQEKVTQEPPYVEIDVHTYTPAPGQFEKFWNLWMTKYADAKKSGQDIVLEDQDRFAYVAPDQGRKAMCVRMTKNHTLILVHFEKEPRDDVVITVIAGSELSSKLLLGFALLIPDSVNVTFHREGHLLASGLSLDEKVFLRDFKTFLGALGDAVFKFELK
jgi:hypothetical protein